MLLNKRFLPASVLSLPVVLIVAIAGIQNRAAFSQDGPVNWRTDFDAARAEAKAQNKPLFVCFR